MRKIKMNATAGTRLNSQGAKLISMWQKALDRQYNLFGTFIIFLVTAFSIVGAVIAGPDYNLSPLQKNVFAASSLITALSVIALLVMAHIERRIAYKADAPPNVDPALQKAENYLRFFANIAIGVVVLAIWWLIKSLI